MGWWLNFIFTANLPTLYQTDIRIHASKVLSLFNRIALFCWTHSVFGKIGMKRKPNIKALDACFLFATQKQHNVEIIYTKIIGKRTNFARQIPVYRLVFLFISYKMIKQRENQTYNPSCHTSKPKKIYICMLWMSSSGGSNNIL